MRTERPPHIFVEVCWALFLKCCVVSFRTYRSPIPLLIQSLSHCTGYVQFHNCVSFSIRYTGLIAIVSLSKTNK
ncbi:hypothetical protein Hanom_Chr09g00816051 [Helianthus anomalus]